MLASARHDAWRSARNDVRNSSAMNYRHAFHAGGFADVIKHIVLVRILTYLQDKPAAFRVIDTHAGAGVYDLDRRRSAPQRRMADRHRADDAGAVFGNDAAAAQALSRHRQGLQSAARAQGLSGIAADRARAAAAAGSPDGLRSRAEGAQAPDRRAAPRHPGPRGRPRRLDGAAGLRAAEGAARPGADRSAVRAEGRVRTAGRRASRRPSRNGRPAAICCGIR